MRKEIMKTSEVREKYRLDGGRPLPQGKGFPRPVVEVDAFTGYRSHLYNEDEFLNKVYPVPYTANDTSLADISGERYRECQADALCIVCGEHTPEDELFGIWKTNRDRISQSWADEPGPFHEKCAKLTMARCPHFVVTARDAKALWTYSIRKATMEDMDPSYTIKSVAGMV